METVRSLDGRPVQLLPGDLQALQSRFSGQLLTRASPEYHAARSIWNTMVDRRPALIARCADAVDVQTMVRFVAEHELLVAIRAGGHNIAGSALCEGGVVIDVSQMRTVRVDPSTRTALVDPGCTLADVDRATQAFGLATPLGINSTTGIAGLTLGGGFGWLSRRLGLTIDNLVSANVVTASGNLARASVTAHEPLFWAIRGGGGNFGVVTSFELALHPIGPEVLTGLFVYPLDAAPAVLRHYRELIAEAPDELAVWAVLRRTPALPFLPSKMRDRPVCILAACYTGPNRAVGQQLFEALRTFGVPLGEHTRTMPYAAWQQVFDALHTHGANNYWKSHNLDTLHDGVIDEAVTRMRHAPAPDCEILFCSVGGEVSRVPVPYTAYAARTAQFIMNVHARWQKPALESTCVEWARAVFLACAPFADGSAYVNFMMADEVDRIPAVYGPNYARLLEVKEQYDPRNLFRVNQNIRPAVVRERLVEQHV